MPVTTTLPRSARMRRLVQFVLATHPPKTYIILTCLWSLSLMLMLQSDVHAVQFNGGMAVVAASFFSILLFLRAVDEIKDVNYDRVHNPDRPLVRGDVSVDEVVGLATGVALTVVVMNAILDWRLAGFVALEMLYGLGLLGLERASKTFRQSILLNLVVTFPVSAALNFYAYLYLIGQEQAPAFIDALPIIAAHMAAFLHFEFGRKLKWPRFAAAGENGYALVLGVRGAVVTCFLLGTLACGLAILFHTKNGSVIVAWLPLLALLPSSFGVARFFKTQHAHQELKPYFALSLVAFFATNIAATLISRFLMH